VITVDQAIFTSRETRRGDGYQLIAGSDGIDANEAKALATWCPAHGAMDDVDSAARSINFFPLPSGRYCLSRTVFGDAEYSGRGGRALRTHTIIGSNDVLQKFANHPFALMNAAIAGGAFEDEDTADGLLPQITLLGKARPVDQRALAVIVAEIGVDVLASMVEHALAAESLAVLHTHEAEHLFAGLMYCLPIEDRREFSLTTGLRFSTSRPFRLHSLKNDREEASRLKRRHGVKVFDATVPVRPPTEGWAKLVHDCLQPGGSGRLEAYFA